MKPLLNTLYVTTQGAYLAKDGETVAIRVEEQVKLRVPVHTLSGIVCFGQVGCSPYLMGFCADRGVGLSFLTEHGRFLARVQGPVSGNVLLRRGQYRRADDAVESTKLAKVIVLAKISNSRNVLLRGARDRPAHEGREMLEQTARRMAHTLTDVERAKDADTVRGLEGDAAKAYFSCFNHLITAGEPEFAFHERSRRPPLDRVNALMSFIYTLVMHDVQGAIGTVGLDPAVGFLHRDRPGRPSLALDLMEEFRAFFADRLVLTLINRRQVQAGGFEVLETGAVLMNEATRKTVLTAYQSRKQEEITHPFLGEKVAAGLLPFLQANLLARHLRGDLDAYPCFLWKG